MHVIKMRGRQKSQVNGQQEGLQVVRYERSAEEDDDDVEERRGEEEREYKGEEGRL